MTSLHTYATTIAVLALLIHGCHKESPNGASGDAAGTVEIVEGKPAPAFTVTAHDGVTLSSAGLLGHPVVLYFYPKDETPGCTKEACAFRDHWEKLSAAGVVLIGVSGDTDESHKKFAEHHQLPFHLVNDVTSNLSRLFSVPNIRGFLARQTIVIGKDGKVKKIYRTVDVEKHAEEIMADTL